jgi:hypothetical protein
LHAQPIDTKITVAAKILRSIGTGKDLDWWKQLNPTVKIPK